MDRLSRITSRTLFLVAFALAGLAVWEKLANMVGLSLTFLSGYAPSRLVELAVVVSTAIESCTGLGVNP